MTVIMQAIVLLAFVLIFGAYNTFGETIWNISPVIGQLVLFALILAVPVSLLTVQYLYLSGMTAYLLQMFSGTQITYGNSMKIARSRLSSLFVYSLLTAVWGWLMRLIETVLRLRSVAFVGQQAWSLGNTFTIPLITNNETAGINAVSDSFALFRRTWGEVITSKVFVGGFLWLIHIASLIVLFTIAYVFPIQDLQAPLTLFVTYAWLIMSIVILLITTIANNIINAALFYYAQHHTVPPNFSPELLSSALVRDQSKPTVNS